MKNNIRNFNSNQVSDKAEEPSQKKEDNILKEQSIDPHYLTKETREEKDIPLVGEMEEKKYSQQSNSKEQSELSTLIAIEEKLEPQKFDSKDEIIYAPYIASPTGNSDCDSIYQKIQLIPFIQENTDTKSENTFLNKKTKKGKSLANKNVNKNIKFKNSIDDCSNFNFDVNFEDDSLFNNFYGLEEDEEVKVEDQDEGQEDLLSIEENALDQYEEFEEPILENEKTLNENDDKFKAEEFKGVLCNNNIYNKAIIEDDEINEERRFTAIYLVDPVEDNTSTYYKSKI